MIQRLSSLHSNVFNKYEKFEVCGLYGNRDIHIQKIKFKKIIHRYNS